MCKHDTNTLFNSLNKTILYSLLLLVFDVGLAEGRLKNFALETHLALAHCGFPTDNIAWGFTE